VIRLPADHPLLRFSRTAFLAAGVGGALCLLGLLFDGPQVARSWLVA
jgi:hypothetical protein